MTGADAFSIVLVVVIFAALVLTLAAVYDIDLLP